MFMGKGILSNKLHLAILLQDINYHTELEFLNLKAKIL